MERDMRAVGEGNKSKAEVLDSSLQQMKACFLDVSCYLALASYYHDLVIKGIYSLMWVT